ncbi:MarR family winged helix-turn-helix transcriptional regulator [Blastococcus sp. Marseille-P5729]|uniref:MarR family winged helix-turn-helix transcriptional regulator n=1 Tax=Blastococcus sp. Marseille-P5729 TaxID=2086582 RepID=UPI000D10DA54|nr:MarR family transcriptional regulator [Blastococcus sp. Marseille-P5729]
MAQGRVGDLELSVGYVLKQVHARLRGAMDEALRPMDLTVPQYACLEILGQSPGLSNSELARRAFVTRQSMNLVVRRLQERGLLTRPDHAEQGRSLPTALTEEGRTALDRASRTISAVEAQVFSALSPQQQRRVRDDLRSCLDPPAVE